MRHSTKLPLLNNVNTLAVIILYENKQKNNITLFVNKVQRVTKVKLWKFKQKKYWYFIFYKIDKCFLTRNSFHFFEQLVSYHERL